MGGRRPTARSLRPIMKVKTKTIRIKVKMRKNIKGIKETFSMLTPKTICKIKQETTSRKKTSSSFRYK